MIVFEAAALTRVSPGKFENVPSKAKRPVLSQTAWAKTAMLPWSNTQESFWHQYWGMIVKEEKP